MVGTVVGTVVGPAVGAWVRAIGHERPRYRSPGSKGSASWSVTVVVVSVEEGATSEVTGSAIETPDGPDDGPTRPTRLRGALEWVAVLVGAVLVALLVRTFLLQAFSIPSSSMETTLEVRDRVLVNKLSYQFGDVERGDIVVFFRPDDLASPYDDLIKRVIGLPGEVVEATENQVFVDGVPLDEPYLDPGVVTRAFGPVEVPADHVFVMGDNRSNSADSRVFGPIEIDRIEGEAFFRYWPLPRIGTP